jgi:hypothetical protein
MKNPRNPKMNIVNKASPNFDLFYLYFRRELYFDVSEEGKKKGRKRGKLFARTTTGLLREAPKTSMLSDDEEDCDDDSCFGVLFSIIIPFTMRTILQQPTKTTINCKKRA